MRTVATHTARLLDGHVRPGPDAVAIARHRMNRRAVFKLNRNVRPFAMIGLVRCEVALELVRSVIHQQHMRLLIEIGNANGARASGKR